MLVAFFECVCGIRKDKSNNLPIFAFVFMFFTTECESFEGKGFASHGKFTFERETSNENLLNQ